MLRAGTVWALPRVFDDLGLDFDAAAEKAGISPGQFDDPESVFPLRALDCLLGVARAEARCEHVGLLVGQAPPNLGLPGFLALHAPSVRRGLLDMIGALKLSDVGGVATMDVHAGEVVLTYTTIAPSLNNADLICDAAAAIGYGLLKLLTVDPNMLSEVRLLRREPADIAPFSAFFPSARIVYDSVGAAISFEGSVLDRPIPGANPALYDYLQHLLQRNFVESGPVALAEQIRAIVPRLLHHNSMTVTQVAQSLGVSHRTLSRWLAEQKTTLGEVITEARVEMSLHLLRHTSMSLSEIAESLSYSDASSFSRVFRARRGLTPGKWRKQNGL